MTTKNKNLLIFILVAVTLMAVFFLKADIKQNRVMEKEEANLINIKTSLDSAPILAKAVSVFNIDKGITIYSKNDETPLPIASLAKILTVATSLGGKKSSETILISKNALDQTGDFSIFANEKWKLFDVAQFTLIASANDGAYALAETNGKDFLEKINVRAKKLGMENSIFYNVTGLDIKNENGTLSPGALASASDVNKMAYYAWKGHSYVFLATALPELNLKSESGFTHNFKNTNVLVGKIPNLLFSKTGFTDLAGGSLTIIFENKKGEEILTTVLGSTFEGRFLDMEQIVNVLY